MFEIVELAYYRIGRRNILAITVQTKYLKKELFILFSTKCMKFSLCKWLYLIFEAIFLDNPLYYFVTC